MHENKPYDIHLIFVSPCSFNIFPKCNQQDATLLFLLISIKCSTWFRRFLFPSSGAQTVYTASGICQTLLLATAIMVGMELVWMHSDQFHPNHDGLKHVEQFAEINKLRSVASCSLHFVEYITRYSSM
jgi:hypothetical protein